MKASNDVAAIMLAGGRGSRLFELTSSVCKPALPFGMHHRIADWTMANLLRSRIASVLIATQYMPVQLEQHLRRNWSDRFPDGLAFARGCRITGRRSGFVGTADAVRQTLGLLRASGAKTLLVVAADHIYRMDYGAMIDAHRSSGAAVTVAVNHTARAAASGFGVVQAGSDNRIADFLEKPADPPGMPGHPHRALVSMGIYAFDLDWLEAELAQGGDDFGYDILPRAVERGCAGFHLAAQGNGDPVYWQDVGTLDAYRSVWIDLEMRPLLCPGPFGSDSIASQAGWMERGVIALPGSRLRRGTRLVNTIVGPGADIPQGEVIGEDINEDSRWFRVTEGGTRLVTRAMMERKTAATPRRYHMHSPLSPLLRTKTGRA